MNPFEVCKRAELAMADVYSVLARYFKDLRPMHTLFAMMVKEEHEHAKRIDAWAKAWKNEHGERAPKADVRELDILTDRIVAFCEELKKTEVIDPEAAIGFATTMEQCFSAAHAGLVSSEMGDLFHKLAHLDEAHGFLFQRVRAKIVRYRKAGTRPNTPPVNVLGELNLNPAV